MLFLRSSGHYALIVGPALGMFGFGWSLTHPPLNSGVVNRVGPDLYGEVNASFNTIRNIAGSLGIAVAVSLLGKAGRPDALAAYHRVFTVFAVSVALCWLVLWLIYPRVSATQRESVERGAAK